MSTQDAWQLVSLAEVATLVKGISYASEDYCGPDEGAIFITIKCVSKAGGFKPEGIKYFKGDIPENQRLSVGDLLIANTDLTRAGDIVGCPITVPSLNGASITLSMDLSKLIEKPDQIDRRFLYYRLMGDDVRSFMKDHASGSTVLHLQTRSVPKLKLNIPVSKNEQSKIAEILSTVDQAIEQTEALIAKQQRIKTGLMQDLLTRGIDEHGQLRTEQTHEFKDSPLGRIPVEWGVSRLGEVADLQVGFAFKSTLFVDDGIRLMRGENVGVIRADWRDTQFLRVKDAEIYKSYLLLEGDLIIGMDRTFTKTGCKVTELTSSDVPCLLVQRVGRFLSKGISKNFMQLLIQAPYYQRALLSQQKGMDIPHLSKDEILSPLVAIPNSQDEMVIVSDELKKVNLNILSLEKGHKKLLHLKTALMQDLLTGRKRVTDLLEPAAA